MSEPHRCIREWNVEKEEGEWERVSHRCYGTDPMILEVSYNHNNSYNYLDDFREIEVNFCPFCGLSAFDHTA